MAKAVAYAGDVVVAESDDTVVVEGNHYFPVADVNQEFLTDSDMHTVCPWKGQASYKNVVTDGKTFENGAWYYPEPKTGRAEVVRDRMAFWQGVRVEEKD